MIASSRPVFVGSVLCALTLHLAGTAFALKPETTQIAASGAAVLTKQGNAFTDLATGVISGVTATNQAASTPPATSTTAAVPQATEPVQSNATNSSAATAKVQAGATAVIPTTTAVTPSTRNRRHVRNPHLRRGETPNKTPTQALRQTTFHKPPPPPAGLMHKTRHLRQQPRIQLPQQTIRAKLCAEWQPCFSFCRAEFGQYAA